VDLVLDPIWFVQSSCSHDFLDDTLTSNESILEATSGPDRPWENMHHRSYFLSELVNIEHDEFRSTLSEMVSHTMVPLYTHGIYAEGDIKNISLIAVIDISCTLGKIENVYISSDCYHKEIYIYTDLFK
jgi:hypothetical protein